jgi:hypothetical protein
MNLRAIKNSIIFQFVDKVNGKGEFQKEATASGIEFSIKYQSDDSAKLPRWVNVISAGPECEFVKPGCQLLLPALRWTLASKLDGVSYWKTDETQAAAMRIVPEGSLIPMNTTLIIERQKKGAISKESVLFVVSGVTDTPQAEVKLAGPKCIAPLEQTTVLYNDANVYEDFVHNGEQLTFIKEEDVIAYFPVN